MPTCTITPQNKLSPCQLNISAGSSDKTANWNNQSGGDLTLTCSNLGTYFTYADGTAINGTTVTIAQGNPGLTLKLITTVAPPANGIVVDYSIAGVTCDTGPGAGANDPSMDITP